jgi:hypothetical protein
VGTDVGSLLNTPSSESAPLDDPPKAIVHKAMTDVENTSHTAARVMARAYIERNS